MRLAVDKLTWAIRCMSATDRWAKLALNALRVAIRMDLFLGCGVFGGRLIARRRLTSWKPVRLASSLLEISRLRKASRSSLGMESGMGMRAIVGVLVRGVVGCSISVFVRL